MYVYIANNQNPSLSYIQYNTEQYQKTSTQIMDNQPAQQNYILPHNQPQSPTLKTPAPQLTIQIFYKHTIDILIKACAQNKTIHYSANIQCLSTPGAELKDWFNGLQDLYRHMCLDDYRNIRVDLQSKCVIIYVKPFHGKNKLVEIGRVHFHELKIPQIQEIKNKFSQQSDQINNQSIKKYIQALQVKKYVDVQDIKFMLKAVATKLMSYHQSKNKQLNQIHCQSSVEQVKQQNQNQVTRSPSTVQKLNKSRNEQMCQRMHSIMQKVQKLKEKQQNKIKKLEQKFQKQKSLLQEKFKNIYLKIPASDNSLNTQHEEAKVQIINDRQNITQMNKSPRNKKQKQDQHQKSQEQKKLFISHNSSRQKNMHSDIQQEILDDLTLSEQEKQLKSQHIHISKNKKGRGTRSKCKKQLTKNQNSQVKINPITFYRIRGIKNQVPQYVPPFINENSAYLCCFQFNESRIMLARRPQQYENRQIVLMGKNLIRHKNSLSIKILKMIRRISLGFGIIDQKRIKRRYCKAGDNVVKITSKGYILDGKKSKKVNDYIFYVGDVIHMKVQVECGLVQWYINNQKIYTCYNQDIKNLDIDWVPFIEMKRIGDQVQWIE